MKQYITHMYKCIELAKKGEGETSPNPMVGCVIINAEGKVISEGYHEKYGQNHAERNALLKLESAKDCTLIVNLEPCSHHGKTPPCTDIIIEKGIKTVVYGMLDPNPIVSGRGLKKLQDAGITVIGPVLEDECKKLNEVFIKNHSQHKTFVAIKTATTIDGKISTYTNDSKWITSELARNEVKNIRKKYDAILTSCATIIADNPTMKHKKKIILDRELKTDLNSQIYTQGEIYVFYNENLTPPNTHNLIKFIKTPVSDNKLDIKFILEKLYELKIMSVLIEAGGAINTALLPYTDKLYHFIAPKILTDNNGKSCFYGNNIEKISNCVNLSLENIEVYPPDILITYSNKLRYIKLPLSD